MRCFICCDGEAKQIEEFMKDPCLEDFNNAHIDLGKTPASCSGILQPSDVSVFFKASKRKLKSIIEQDKKYSYPLLESRLQEIFKGREGFSHGNRKYVIALQKIIRALSEVYHKHTITDGYEKSGIYPIDFDKSMNMCTNTIGLKDRTNMLEKLPQMVTVFLEKGMLTESDMDDAGIIKVEGRGRNKKAKDQRVIHQQRAVMLTDPETVSRQQAYLTAKFAPKPKAKPKKRAKKAAVVKPAKAPKVANIVATPKTTKPLRKKKKNARTVALRPINQAAHTNDDYQYY